MGGIPYLTQCFSNCISPSNATRYARIIREKAARRKVIQECDTTKAAAYDGEDISETLQSHRMRIQQISVTGERIEDVHIAEVAKLTLASIEWRYDHKNEISGITSGLGEIDNITDGWQKGNLIIVGGRPSDGKSAIGMNFARNSGVTTGVFHLEMSDLETGLREVAGSSGINMK